MDIDDEQDDLLEEIVPLRAMTVRGLLARVKTLTLAFPPDEEGLREHGCVYDRMLSALLEDMLAYAAKPEAGVS